MGRPSVEETERRWRMRPEDLVPCTVCHLRGHVAGDPEKCLHGDAGARRGVDIQ